MQRRMLSQEDEAAVGADETQVRKEDQDQINKFSRLHQRETLLEEELKAKIKEKEDLDEIASEIEIVDEDDSIPYKIGDTFFSLPLPQVQTLLAASTTQIEHDVDAVEENLAAIRDEMRELKVALYARFGRSINLET